MKRALAMMLLLATTQTAIADKVLVLKAEGRADAKVRAKVDATVARLAQSSTDDASPGEITYTDAAAMVGCKPEDAGCRDEVIGMLAVDEIVIVTVTPKPGGFDVQVRRAGKAGASREASTFVAAEGLDKLDAIAPLFGGATSSPPTTGPTTTTDPALTTTTTAPPIETGGPITDPATTTTAPPSSGMQPVNSSVQQVDTVDTNPHKHRTAHAIGMVVGGSLTLLGLLSWGAAASTANEIAEAPAMTLDHIAELQELEKQGDAQAAVGNLFVVTGVVVGGISTYFFLRGRSRERRARSAAVTPVLMPGNGIGLSFGGTL